MVTDYPAYSFKPTFKFNFDTINGQQFLIFDYSKNSKSRINLFERSVS